VRKCSVNNENQEQALKAILLIKIIYELYNYYKNYTVFSTIEQKKMNNNKNCPINKEIKDNDSHVEEIFFDKVTPKITVQEDSNENTIIVDIPVVIAEKRISIPIEEEIDFNENITEILRTKSDVYITDSKFIPMGIPKKSTNEIEGELLLEGKLISTVEYNSFEELNSNAYKGYIKTLKLFFPFKFNTIIHCYCPEKRFSNDKNYKSISCHINEANIFTTDTILDMDSNGSNSNCNIFKKINRKNIINLLITVTQIYPIVVSNNFTSKKSSSMS